MIVSLYACTPLTSFYHALRCPDALQLISDHLNSGGGVFGSSGSAVAAHQRPLLLILDRSADLVTPLRHTSTYQALLDDVLEHRVNRVTVDIEGKVRVCAAGSIDMRVFLYTGMHEH